jgi:hypothetical protein
MVESLSSKHSILNLDRLNQVRFASELQVEDSRGLGARQDLNQFSLLVFGVKVYQAHLAADIKNIEIVIRLAIRKTIQFL